MSLRVLVCGSRHYDDRVGLYAVLNAERIGILIEGEASGADTLAAEWARAHSVPVEAYPADWERHGRAAGPIRNQQMLDEGKPDLVIVFPLPDSRGTWDMVRRARAAKIPVTIYDPAPSSMTGDK